jgi:dipeptidyl aminopeptidase/acylaminoacyl peptidase
MTHPQGHMMFDTEKPKNDDKPKGRPRLFLLAAIALIISACVPIAGLHYLPLTDAPRHKLLYKTGSPVTTYQVDFQSGQRTAIEYNYTGSESSFSYPSPDGLHIARWELIPGESDKWSLLLLDRESQAESRTLGMFYGITGRISWSPDQQWLVFTAMDRDIQVYDPTKPFQRSELWMLHISTGEIKQLTTNVYEDSEPLFSPNGTQLVYLSASDGYRRIHIMDLETGESRLITANQEGQNPLWSPDGQWIAFEAYYRAHPNDPYVADINAYVVRADGNYAQSVGNETNGDEYLIGWELPE